MNAEDMAMLRAENARLRAQVDSLQADNTRLVLELRATDRKRMVREFFVIADQKIGERPHVPDDATVRFRLRLIAEEFFELLHAANCDPAVEGVGSVESVVMDAIDTYSPIAVDLPALADATVDMDFVSEGLRVHFGINSTPLWAEVAACNLAKRGGPKRDGDLKLGKPSGWQPPRIRELLLVQGWDGRTA